MLLVTIRKQSIVSVVVAILGVLCMNSNIVYSWINHPYQLQQQAPKKGSLDVDKSLDQSQTCRSRQKRIQLISSLLSTKSTIAFTTTNPFQGPLSSLHLSSSDDDSFTTTTTTTTLDGKPIRQPIQPLANFILVKLKDTLQATSGGILLPDQSKERSTEGTVIESGLGRFHPYTGVRITNPITKGMSVVFGKYDGSPVVYNGEECQMIRDDDVLLAYTGGVTMRLENVIPIRDYVLIEIENDSKEILVDNVSSSSTATAGITATKSGVVIASSVLKDLVPCQGRVVKIGPGRMASDGTYTKSPVNVGDMVKFKDYAGNDVMIEGKAYSVVKMVDILCTYKGSSTETTM